MKPSSGFYRNSKGHYRKHCKECWKAREQRRKARIPQAEKAAGFRRWRRENRAKALISIAKWRAKQKGLDFDLDRWAGEIQGVLDAGVCELTGIPFNFDGGKTWDSPSLDRIDSAKGYTLSNVRVVLYCLNVMANIWGENKIIEMADAIMARRRDRSAKLQGGLESALKRLIDTQASPEYELTWKASAMQSGPPICRLAARGRRTSGSGCSGWPSPKGIDATSNAEMPDARMVREGRATPSNLTTAARLAGWPTPMAGSPATEDCNEAGNTDSSRKTVELLAGWATPRAEDAESAGMRHARGQADTLSAQAGQDVASSPAATGSSVAYLLNPRFSLWLQGYPEEWASCGERGIQSCRKRRRSSSRRS